MRCHVIVANFIRHLRQHVIHENHFGIVIAATPGPNHIAAPSNSDGKNIVLRFHDENLRNGTFQIAARGTKVK